MLALLTKRLRIWSAGILVAAYALAVLAPSLAFSLDSEVSIIHSLTEAHGGLLIPHYHHDDAIHHKNSGQDVPAGAHHCCGVLAPPGLLPPTDVSIADQICVSLVPSVPQDHHAGCGPSRLDRPPRLSSLI
jgi:hypothetical protein